jgi:hypothetical protein
MSQFPIGICGRDQVFAKETCEFVSLIFLSTKVMNLGNSAEYRVRIFFRVDSSTTEAQLRELEAGLRQFVSSHEDRFRIKTFAFWLALCHEKEKYYWDELDEIECHTVGFQVSCPNKLTFCCFSNFFFKKKVKLTNVPHSKVTVVYQRQTELLLEYKRLCKEIGIKPRQPLSSVLQEEQRRGYNIPNDSRYAIKLGM